MASGTLGCFEYPAEGCGGGFGLPCHAERAVEDGFEIVEPFETPFVWTPQDGWGECASGGAPELPDCQ